MRYIKLKIIHSFSFIIVIHLLEIIREMRLFQTEDDAFLDFLVEKKLCCLRHGVLFSRNYTWLFRH